MECTEGDLTIKVENNTATGAGVQGAVEDHSQGLMTQMFIMPTARLILLKMKPYREKNFAIYI